MVSVGCDRSFQRVYVAVLVIVHVVSIDGDRITKIVCTGSQLTILGYARNS